MRIAVITSPFHELPPIAIGAVEKLFYQLAGAWADAGHEVAFVCAGGGNDGRMRFVRLKKYSRTGSTKKDLVWDFFYSIKAIWRCPKTDVLVCNTFWSPVLAPMMRWKYRKLIYGVHLTPKGQYWLYRFVHRFICVSHAVADRLGREVSGGRICVVPNPIDTVVFAPDARTPERGRVAYAGRIHPSKGLLTLARACARLYEEGLVRELLLIGTWDVARGGGGDEFLSACHMAAGECPVVASGAIADQVKLAEQVRTAEVFAYPSEVSEAFGVAPLEAMALGVPTVVSDFRCFTEFVEPEANALVFKTGDVERLYLAIKCLLTDRALCERLSAEAVRKSKSFDVRNIAARYLRVFED